MHEVDTQTKKLNTIKNATLIIILLKISLIISLIILIICFCHSISANLYKKIFVFVLMISIHILLQVFKINMQLVINLEILNVIERAHLT